MTEDQIKAIAEEYAKEQVVSGNYDLINAIEVTSTMLLKWLSTRYCIVEREKVVEQHKFYMDKMKQVSSAKAINRAKAIALENLFGTSMFNQNEE